MRDPQCIFCKIVSVEIPASVVYEDEAALAFLDIGPLSEGHLLVIPRLHYERLIELPADTIGRLARLFAPLGRALLSVTGASAFNVLCNQGSDAGQVVPHVHFHLIPRRKGDSLGFRWHPGTYPPGRAQLVADAYQQALARQGSD